MTVQELTDKLGAYAPQMQVYFREPYDEGDTLKINSVWESETIPEGETGILYLFNSAIDE